MSNVITPEFRASYANVFQPVAAKNNDGTPKLKNGQPVMEYSVMALFPLGADLSELKAAAAAAVKEKWGDKPPKNLKSPFRDQEEREKDGALPDGHVAGAIFMNFKSTQKPGLVDGRNNNQDIIDPVAFYSGCWARASVRAYCYDVNGNKGVAFGLQNLQKTKDDTPLGGSRVKASDEFAPVANAGADSADSLFD